MAAPGNDHRAVTDAPAHDHEASRLFARLTASGVVFRVDGGHVRWRCPDGAMRLSDVIEIKRHAAAIALIIGQVRAPPPSPARHERARH